MQTGRIEPVTFQQQDAGCTAEPQQLSAEHDLESKSSSEKRV